MPQRSIYHTLYKGQNTHSQWHRKAINGYSRHKKSTLVTRQQGNTRTVLTYTTQYGIAALRQALQTHSRKATRNAIAKHQFLAGKFLKNPAMSRE
jgi:hypothetical protein